MLRVLKVICLAAAVAGLFAGTAVAGLFAGTAVAAPGRAIVRLAQCRISDTAEGRSATFLGRMRALPGTERMSMRFTLLERLGRRPQAPLDVPALSLPRVSRPGVRMFGYRQEVRALLKGGTYRMRVEFRWEDAAGKPLKSAVRRSGACHQPGRPPNLRVGSVWALPSPAPGVGVYAVSVANVGGTELRAVRLGLAVDGVPLSPRAIGSLAPGEVRVIEVSGPACRAEMEVAVDPQQGIRESNEADNVRVGPCPAPRP